MIVAAAQNQCSCATCAHETWQPAFHSLRRILAPSYCQQRDGGLLALHVYTFVECVQRLDACWDQSYKTILNFGQWSNLKFLLIRNGNRDVVCPPIHRHFSLLIAFVFLEGLKKLRANPCNPFIWENFHFRIKVERFVRTLRPLQYSHNTVALH